MPIPSARWAAATAVGLGVAAAGAAQSQILGADVGKSIQYQQTGPASVDLVGGFFAAEIFSAPSSFSEGSVSFSGPGSPQLFRSELQTVFYIPDSTLAIDCCLGGQTGDGYQSGYLTLSDLANNYPTGIEYDLEADSPRRNTYQAVQVAYVQDLYTTAIPALTAASFAALQGVNPSVGVTVHFDSFTPNPDATASGGVFILYDTTTDRVALVDDFSPSTTSVTLAPGVLTPGAGYTYELIFDDRITGSAGGVPTAYFSDVRTFGAFDAALPEPADWVLVTLGVAAIGGVLRRGRRAIGA